MCLWASGRNHWSAKPIIHRWFESNQALKLFGTLFFNLHKYSIVDYCKMKKHRFNYFYRITNNINGHYYYGVHSTDDINDGYMGSGKRLHLAYKKYGKENFTKEILKYFDTYKDAYEYENSIVNETLLKDDSCYNIKTGGFGGQENMLVAQDNSGKKYYINKNDERLKTGELHFIWVGRERTKESRDKIRNTTTNKENPAKRIFMNKDGVFKYVPREDVEKLLQDGWELGRPKYKPEMNREERKKRREEKEQKLNEKKNIKSEQILERIHIIEQSDIDFSKYGWVLKVSKLTGLLPQKVNVFMKKYMPEFYSNCFIRK